MPTCFVMQPFDKGKYDDRYRDTFEPAIRKAGFEPYRVDNDPSVIIPIEDIEKGIRHADICFAEITEDNPNVWFELGYAIACHKPIVLVCAEDRTKFPFDVQHRTIIRYKTSSAGNFTKLRKEISDKLRAIFERESKQIPNTSVVKTSAADGLDASEVAALVVAAETNLDDKLFSDLGIVRRMEDEGYSRLAARLAIRSLEAKGYVEGRPASDEEAQEDYTGINCTSKGWIWINDHKEAFMKSRKDTT